MRWDEQGWTRYGPAMMHDLRGGVDAKGNIVAFEATVFAQASTSTPATRVLANGETPGNPGGGATNAENLLPMYKVANNALGGQGLRVISKTQTKEFGMFQNGTLRAPQGPQTNFASEQFVDMLAEAAGMDPYNFRLQNMRTDGAPGRAASGPATAACSRRPSRPPATSRTCPPRSSRAGTSSPAGAWESAHTTTPTPPRSRSSK